MSPPSPEHKASVTRTGFANFIPPGSSHMLLFVLRDFGSFPCWSSPMRKTKSRHSRSKYSMGKHSPGSHHGEQPLPGAAGLCRWNHLDTSLDRDCSGCNSPKENTRSRAPVTLQLLENDLDGQQFVETSKKNAPTLLLLA